MDDPDERRRRARELARDGIAAGDPVGWFERLYSEAGAGLAAIPWEDDGPSPTLVDWVDRHAGRVRGRRVLVVGCGSGHDAVLLAEHGARVVAVDVSPSAIDAARARYGDRRGIEWEVGDLRRPASHWIGAFDLVVEIHTLQVLLDGARRELEQGIANVVADGGVLFLCCRLRDEHEAPGEMPWPLTEAELARFESEFGFELLESGDGVPTEQPPARRAVRTWRR